MKIAFLYAGQGSQFEKMGLDLYENEPVFKETLDKIDTNGKIKDLCFNADLETLSVTSNTQPCMVAFAIGITNVLKSKNIKPCMTAGLSLGEYSALNCAGVLEDTKAIELVTFRGEQMVLASQGLDCMMSAILGLDREKLQECCDKASENGDVSIANYNCPGQLVIAGSTNACKDACKLALENGAKRAIELNVSGPFHTKFMALASKALDEEFKDSDFLDMKIPVVFNTLGKEKSQNQDIKSLLVNQVKSSVYFEDSINYMIEQGVDTFIEIGGGKVLSGFIKKISKQVKTYAVYDNKTLEDTLQKLEGDEQC